MNITRLREWRWRRPEVESVITRPARLGDETSVARVHVRAWQAGYRTLMPEAYLSSLRLEDRAKRYTFGDLNAGRPQTWVAEEPGESGSIVGLRPLGARMAMRVRAWAS
jgi:hypothetical protein